MSVTSAVQEEKVYNRSDPINGSLKVTACADEKRTLVLLPDMFVSFLAQKPRINPHYDAVKIESEAWIERFVDLCSSIRT